MKCGLTHQNYKYSWQRQENHNTNWRIPVSQNTIYAVDTDGNYLGAFTGAQIPPEAIEVPFPPETGDMIWDFDNEIWNTPSLDIDKIDDVIYNFINVKPKEMGYLNSATCISYENSSNPIHRRNSDAFMKWRDSVLKYKDEEKLKMINESRTVPSEEDFINELPVLTWPNEFSYTPTAVSFSVLAVINIESGEIQEVDSSTGISATWKQDVGVFWIFFANEEIDDKYFISVSCCATDNVFVEQSNKFETYCIVEAVDTNGSPVDPHTIVIEVKRIK